MKLLSYLMLSVASVGSPARLYTFHHENVLGTSLEFKALAADEAAAQRAERAALDEIDRLNKILSGYDAESEFSRWARTHGGAVRVSPELFAVLGQFDAWQTRTNGALDAAAETVTRVWKQAAREQRVPTSQELASAVALVKQPHWRLDVASRTATHLSDAPLMLNSFAKSYIVDKAAGAAMATGALKGVVVNIGGDLVARGDWNEPVRVADPRADGENGPALAELTLRDRAVATSGGYRRGVTIAGKHYSHIVDPRTGRPADEILSATVAARDAATAGALATAFAVLPLNESVRLAQAVAADVDYLMVDRSGRRVTSPRWAGLAAAAQPGTALATGEVAIELELARISDGRYRRPYVAVWVEDKDKFPLRTVALWLEKTRWLPDLKSWYHSDRMRSMAEGKDITGSVSSATRPPGKYTLRWDGKDQAGSLVKPGKYTICIEAAREHGTYQVIRQEIDFGGASKQFTLPGGTEIATIAVDYRKK